MQKQLTPHSSSGSTDTSAKQSVDASRPPAGSQQETRAITLQIPSNDFPVRITGTPPDYIAPSIQIAVAILSAAAGAYVIIWQMRRQRELADTQHRSSVKAELRLDAYRDFQIANRNLSDTRSIFTDLISMKTAFSIAIAQVKSKMPQTPLLQRTPEFMAAYSKHGTNIIALIYFLERYESLLPGFEVYKLALSSALHDAREASSRLFSVLLKWLPIENPNSEKVIGAAAFMWLPLITDEALSELNQAAAPLEKALGQLDCWALDLAVDVQNYLLGEYADQIVKKRQPIDDETYFTISIDQDKSVALKKYFNEETEWGRNAAKVDQEVRREHKVKK